jgi:hypothetical protein
MTLRTSHLAAGAICAVLIALISPYAASARTAAGRLDPIYGKRGVTTTAFGVAGEASDAELTLGPRGTALLADGRAGKAVRFGASGSWDTHFGKGGRLAVAPATTFDQSLENFSPASITIDASERVVVFGALTLLDQAVTNQAATLEFATVAAVLRFAAGGRRLDPSFGEGKGYVEGDFGLPPNPTG